MDAWHSWLRGALTLLLMGGTCGRAPAEKPRHEGTVLRPERSPRAERFRKIEARIPMRDGVRLYTTILVPREAKAAFPILLQRTPYSCAPYTPDTPPHEFYSEGILADGTFAFAYQDVRGRYLSEGTYVDARPVNANRGPKDIDETTDTYDTLEWLVANIPGNNGRIGLKGISYPGHYAAQGMLCGHPALKAASPQAPILDFWEGDDWYHRGAFQLTASFDFYLSWRTRGQDPAPKDPPPISVGTQDGYTFFLEQGPVGPLGQRVFKGIEPLWDSGIAHWTYDSYWQKRNLRPHIRNVLPAVLTVGGWYDAEDLFGPLALHQALKTQSPGTRRHLVMGPWSHGAWSNPEVTHLGHTHFGDNVNPYYQELEYRFFAQHLKGERQESIPEATVFETGANRWRTFATWPPPEARPMTFYFRTGGTLATSAPTEAEALDTFVSDPAKPVPYTQAISFSYHAPYMAEDQRFASRRPDVLVYRSEPLTQDLTLAGPLKAILHVSTSGTDSDWVVKLVDVLPTATPDPPRAPEGWHAGGAQLLVRGDVIRGKFRKNFEKPEPFVPHQPDVVGFTLPDVCHTFRKGHRIMIQVQCSWFPLVDRNPQTFTDIFWAKPEAFVPATQRVFRDALRPSRLEVSVLPPG